MSKGKATGPQTSAEIQADIEARRAELDALDEQRREARNAIRRAERAAEKAAAREAREREAVLGLGIVAELRALGVGDDELAFAGVVAKLARHRSQVAGRPRGDGVGARRPPPQGGGGQGRGPSRVRCRLARAPGSARRCARRGGALAPRPPAWAAKGFVRRAR